MHTLFGVSHVSFPWHLGSAVPHGSPAQPAATAAGHMWLAHACPSSQPVPPFAVVEQHGAFSAPQATQESFDIFSDSPHENELSYGCVATWFVAPRRALARSSTADKPSITASMSRGSTAMRTEALSASCICLSRFLLDGAESVTFLREADTRAALRATRAMASCTQAATHSSS